MKTPPGVLAAFRHVDAAASAIRSLRELGYERELTVYTPVPNHEIQEAVGHRVSPVRVWTLIGGVTGCVVGFAMALWMSYDWPIVVGGKPLGSVIPYVVIAFELTILLGAGATIVGLIVHSWLARRAAAYDGRFTDDMIGVFVECPVERRPSVQEVLERAGAEEVRVET